MLEQYLGNVESSNGVFQSMIADAEQKERQFFVRLTFAYEVKVLYSQMYSVGGDISLVRSHHGIWLRMEENLVPSDSDCGVFLFELDRSYGFNDYGDVARTAQANKSQAGRRGRRAIIEL